MIAIAAFTFIAALAFFIIIVSRQNLSESRRFYLSGVIVCAILADRKSTRLNSSHL